MNTGLNRQVFEVGDVVKVTNVDLDGFQGRNHHPDLSDVGHFAEVLNVQEFKEEDYWDAPGDLDYTLVTAKTIYTGRILEFIDFEIEKL